MASGSEVAPLLSKKGLENGSSSGEKAGVWEWLIGLLYREPAHAEKGKLLRLQ
jgi:hypothetical protein